MGLEKTTEAMRVGRDLRISCISFLSFKHNVCFNHPRAEAQRWRGMSPLVPAAVPALTRAALHVACSR